MTDKNHTVGFEAPDLAPVIVTEHTRAGWRGLTADGEIYNVSAHVNGEPARIPESLAVQRRDETIGYHKVTQKTTEGVIDNYLKHLNESTRLTRLNENEQALEQISLAMGYASTALARYNRAMIMLSLGYLQEGFDEFAYCERTSDLFMRPEFRKALDNAIEPWRGQDIRDKVLLLIHDHGFGDTIMCLRYIAQLKAMGAHVIVQCPVELASIARQHADVVVSDIVAADYFCSMLMLMQVLQEFPGEWRGPYIKVDPKLVEKWRDNAEWIHGPNIGFACDVGKAQDGDYPRSCPADLFGEHLGGVNVSLWDVQQNSKMPFDDFADCAALMSLMDEIVTVDTAAVHLAGAIGHPNVTLLLSRWHSWRWRMPLYPNVRIFVQTSDGDWDSVFAQRRDAVL